MVRGPFFGYGGNPAGKPGRVDSIEPNSSGAIDPKELNYHFRGKAKVDRVVSGNLVYVTSDDNRETFVFKPDRLRFQQKDGTIRRYKGEPLASVGIQPGTNVIIGQHAGDPVVAVEYHPTRKGHRWSIK